MVNTSSAPGKVLFYKHPEQSPAAETQAFSALQELGCPAGLWLPAHQSGGVLQVLVSISYSGSIFQSHVELGRRRGRPECTLLQKQAQLWHGAFSNPSLSHATAEIWTRRERNDPEALATTSLRPRAVLRCGIHLQFPSLD